MTDALRRLPEASYDGLRFPVERLDWQGGNDLVEHVAYRRPGADVEPTGRKALRGSMVVPLVNTPSLVAQYGELFPLLRSDLLRRFADSPIATLMHPTLGRFTAAIGEVSETADASDRGGVRMTVQFVEHNASVALVVGDDASGDPVASAQTPTDLARAADRANIGVTGYQATSQTVAVQMAYLADGVRTFTQTQNALRAMLAPVEANLLLPALATASGHSAYIASVALRAGIYAQRDRLLPSTQSQSFYTTPREMADWEVAHAVYGDAALSTLIRGANSIANPLEIPAGRTLMIIPAPSV